MPRRRARPTGPPLFCIVGYSGSGKTRLAAALVGEFKARGYRVAAIKHAAHGHQMDLPGKDSSLIFSAGADKVVVTSPGRVSTTERREGDASLEELTTPLARAFDIIVVEGFKEGDAPKVLVLAKDSALEDTIPMTNVLATVGEPSASSELPHFTFDRVKELADLLIRHLQRSP